MEYMPVVDIAATSQEIIQPRMTRWNQGDAEGNTSYSGLDVHKFS